MDNILRLFPQDKLDLLSETEEKEIFKKINDKARERILYAHIRLVVKICQKYQGYGLDLEDLVSEGCIGLFSAMDRFDENKGAKFSYYASFWIKQAIVRALSKQGRLIRLPAGITADFLNILKLYNIYKERGQEIPPKEETANKLKIPLQRVKNILGATEIFLRLDGPVSGSETNDRPSIEEIIEDKEATLPIERLVKAEKEVSLQKYLSKLSGREQIIIKERFGFESGREQTLREIAGRLNLSRERVRQIEARTIEKLKEMFDKETETQ